MQRRSEYVGAGTIDEAASQLRSDGELSPGHRAVHEQYAFSLFFADCWILRLRHHEWRVVRAMASA